MGRRKYEVNLNDDERDYLLDLTHKGKDSARKLTRARVLLLVDSGKMNKEIADVLDICKGTVTNICRRYCEEGLEEAINEKPRPGQPGIITDDVEAQLTVLACSAPPVGYERWTLRLLADKMVELEIVDSISHEGVRQTLKKKKIKPWQSKQWCIPNINAEFIYKMEDTLNVYSLPYDPKRPVICFDESPYQLLGHLVDPIPMKPGEVRKYDHHYKRNGSCNVFMAFEPLTGKRIVEIRERRTAQDYALFMRKVIEEHYKDADKVLIVQDNLNTHNPASFYKFFEPEKAFELADKLEWHYTPKKASWLNMVEIEFSVMRKQCVNRRIPTMEKLEREVKAWAEKREKDGKKVKWKFRKENARVKLKIHYDKVKN